MEKSCEGNKERIGKVGGLEKMPKEHIKQQQTILSKTGNAVLSGKFTPNGGSSSIMSSIMFLF